VLTFHEAAPPGLYGPSYAAPAAAGELGGCPTGGIGIHDVLLVLT